MNNPFQQIPGLMPQSNPAMEQVGQMFGMAQALQNPRAAFGQMMGNNDQIKQVMQYVQSHGGDARSAFYDKKYDECREIAALATAAVDLNGHTAFVIGVTKSKGSIVTSGEKKDVYACYYTDAN